MDNRGKHSKKKLGGITTEQLENAKKNGDLLKCSSCNLELPYIKFGFKLHKKNGLLYTGYTCSHCVYMRRKEKYKEKFPAYIKQYRKNTISTLSGRAGLIVYRVKQRTKKSNLDFDLTKDFILTLLSQKKCAVTGIKLNFDAGFTYHPFSPSLDRIDNTKGYTKDNVQIVCMMYNFCKNGFTDKQVLEFIKIAYINLYGTKK